MIKVENQAKDVRDMTLTPKTYKKRIIDARVAKFLKTFGAVCLEGPKWCGKTWTALNHAQSVYYVGDPAKNFQNRANAELSPEYALKGKCPHLIDEWQEVPPLWDAVRFGVDQATEKGRFLLTGSATPAHKGILHSGTGRIGTLRMHTMSLFESGDSSGDVSLAGLFKKKLPSLVLENVELERLVHLTVRGGWPASINVEPQLAHELAVAYLNTVVNEDMYEMDGIRRDYTKARLLLKSLARNETTVVTNAKLAADMQSYDGESISREALGQYLDIFTRLFIIEDQPAFSPNLRSGNRVVKGPKRHFSDPSLAVAALGVNTDLLMQDLKTFGFLFEALCERDLRIYAEAAGGHLFHYRDYAGREIDAVVELPDGRWGAFEIKLGANQIDKAATNLLAIKESMLEKPPAFLCVICGLTNMAYTRKDGVMVVPITALKD